MITSGIKHHSCSLTCTMLTYCQRFVCYQQNPRGAGHRDSWFFFFRVSFIFMTYPTLHHILCPHRISVTALVYLIFMTLANSHSSIQDAPAPHSFSIRSSNGICSKSSYVSNIAGPLCSSGITFSHYLLLRSLVPEVEVTRTVTQSQSDKMHNRRCCRELGSFGKASTRKKDLSACDRVLRGFGAVHNLHSTVY